MFIAIEGSDGAGKSSLIEAIKAQFRDETVTLHHKGKPPEETRRCLLMEYAINFQHENLFDSIHLADRWHWGERTYAPLKRPHTNTDGYGLLGMAGWRWVELFMQSRGIAQFLLYQKLDVIKERIRSRGDDFVVEADLEWIYNAYNEASKVAVLAETIMPGPNSFAELPEFAKHIVDVARQVSDGARFLGRYPQYIGSTHPAVLLVGDKRNITDKYGEETILPFMPVRESSGDYLMSSLPDALWKNVGIVNGSEISADDLSALHRDLGSPRVAVLGRLAEKSILRTTIHQDDYVTIPHPQYARRFRNHEKQDYGLAIEEISRGEEVPSWALS